MKVAMAVVEFVVKLFFVRALARAIIVRLSVNRRSTSSDGGHGDSGNYILHGSCHDWYGIVVTDSTNLS